MTATRATLPAVNVTLSIGQADSLVNLFRVEADRLDAMVAASGVKLVTKAGELRAMAADVEAIVNEMFPERRDMSRVR